MLTVNSKTLLAQAHPDLRRLATAVAAKGPPFRVICGYRGEREQARAFAIGASKAKFGQSPHNFVPSLAIDVAPGWEGPLKWSDTKGFEAVGRAFVATAKELKIPIRWGADWDMDGKTTDEKFVDFPHIELHPWRTYKGAKA